MIGVAAIIIGVARARGGNAKEPHAQRGRAVLSSRLVVVLAVFLCISTTATTTLLLIIVWFGFGHLMFPAQGLALYYAFRRHKSNQIKSICVKKTL